MKKYEVVYSVMVYYGCTKLSNSSILEKKVLKAMQTGELEITNEAKDRYVKRTIEK